MTGLVEAFKARFWALVEDRASREGTDHSSEHARSSDRVLEDNEKDE